MSASSKILTGKPGHATPDPATSNGINQPIVESVSGYKKPSIHVTDGASWSAVLRKFHYEGNEECAFIITPAEGSIYRKASRESDFTWIIFRMELLIGIFGLFVFLLIAFVVPHVVVTYSDAHLAVVTAVQNYLRDIWKVFKL